MTRLDHNRGLYQLSNKLNTHVSNIEQFAIWGNHSSTMYPDVSHATVEGKPILEKVDKEWLTGTFTPKVQ